MGPIANTVYVILHIYLLIMFARVLMGLIPELDTNHPIARFLYESTEPLLQPIREFLMKQFPDTMGFDFSPLVVFFGISILRYLLTGVPI
jgi:YggT family protein